jgi:hypothetical protein
VHIHVVWSVSEWKSSWEYSTYESILKFTLLQASWPWRVGKGIAQPILNLGTRRG